MQRIFVKPHTELPTDIASNLHVTQAYISDKEKADTEMFDFGWIYDGAYIPSRNALLLGYNSDLRSTKNLGEAICDLIEKCNFDEDKTNAEKGLHLTSLINNSDPISKNVMLHLTASILYKDAVNSFNKKELRDFALEKAYSNLELHPISIVNNLHQFLQKELSDTLNLLPNIHVEISDIANEDAKFGFLGKVVTINQIYNISNIRSPDMELVIRQNLDVANQLINNEKYNHLIEQLNQLPLADVIKKTSNGSCLISNINEIVLFSNARKLDAQDLLKKTATHIATASFETFDVRNVLTSDVKNRICNTYASVLSQCPLLNPQHYIENAPCSDTQLKTLHRIASESEIKPIMARELRESFKEVAPLAGEAIAKEIHRELFSYFPPPEILNNITSAAGREFADTLKEIESKIEESLLPINQEPVKRPKSNKIRQ